MRDESSRRTLLVAWAHLAVLWAFAVAQPLLDVLGDTPEFFVARGNTGGDILLLAFTLVLVPPTALWLLELALVRLPRARAAVHLALVALLVAVFAVQAIEDVAPGLAAPAAILLALAAGAGAAVLYARRTGVRSFLTVLSPAPALFLALFLLFSPTSELVLPQDETSAAGAGGGTPVVMLVFDELPGASLLDHRGRIDAVRYPNFARLARGSTWYPNATTVDYSTERAVPAVMTGMQPEDDSLAIAADHPRSIFTLLGERYRFHVQEPATQICPESLCGERLRKERAERLRSLADDLGVVALHLVAPGDLEDDLPAVDNTFEGFGGDDEPKAASGTRSGIPASAFEDRTRQFDLFLRRMGADRGSPTLDFLHVALPHWPWQFLPSGQQYPSNTDRIPGLKDSTWGRDPALATQGYQRYLLQLGYVDRLIGRLVDRLRASGLWDDAAVVVTADHGASYRAGQPRRIPTRENLPDIASVPLFVKEPGRAGGRIDRSPVRTVDVVPTIADAIGAPTGWRFDGRSVLGGAPDRTTVDVRSGEDVSMSVAEFERARDAEVRRRIELFGERDRGAGIFAAGGTGALIGRAVAGLGAPPAEGLRAELDDSALLGDVRPGSGVIPALVRGRISGPLAPGSTVAVALNGSVRALASTYEDAGEHRFGAMLPASAFRAGANRVELFRVGGAAGQETLAAIPQAGGAESSGRLAAGDGRIELSGGRSLPVTDDAVTGFVETVKAVNPAQLVAVGWAADPNKKRHVRRVLAFADGRLVGSARPEQPRVDVVASHGRAALYSGYRLALSLPDADAVAGDPERLRVFGLLGGRASELKRLGG